MGIKWNDWDWHPKVRSGEQLTFAERAADWAIQAMGSWAYLIGQTLLILAWMTFNWIYVPGIWMWHWDPRPWIMLNLVFSIQAAYATPLLLLAGRRTDQKTSERSEYDHNLLRKIAQQVGIDEP